MQFLFAGLIFAQIFEVFSKTLSKFYILNFDYIFGNSNGSCMHFIIINRNAVLVRNVDDRHRVVA